MQALPDQFEDVIALSDQFEDVIALPPRNLSTGSGAPGSVPRSASHSSIPEDGSRVSSSVGLLVSPQMGSQG